MSEVSQLSPPDRLRKRARQRVLVLFSLLVVVVGVSLAVAMGWIMPREYESMAVIQVTAVAEGEELAAEEAARVMEAEARRLLAVPTLDRVRSRLALDSRWEMEQEAVREALREAVRVEVVPESGLIEIRVRQREATEARLLAYAVAEAYRDLRNAEEEQKAQGLLKALEAELEEQERKVEEKRKALERVLEEGGFEYEVREKQASLLRDLQQRRTRLEGEVSLLEDLRGDLRYRHAAGLERRQNSAALLYGEYELVKRASIQLRRSGLGEAHPLIVAQDIRLSMVKGDLEHCIKELAQVTESELEGLMQKMARLEEGLVQPVSVSPAVAVAMADQAGNVPVWHAVQSAREELADEESLAATLRARREGVREGAGARGGVVRVVPAERER